MKRFYNTSPSSMRILILSTTGLGDSIWATPAIQSIKNHYPNSYVGVLTSPVGFATLKGNPSISRLWTMKKGFFSFVNLIKTLRAQKFEIAILFHTSQRVAPLIAYFSGAKKIIGYKDSQKGLDFILTDSIKVSNVHEIEKRLRLLQPLNIHTSTKKLEIYLDETEKKEANHKILSLVGEKKDTSWILFHTGAKDLFKQWPVESFVQLGLLFQRENSNTRILLTGNEEEKLQVDHIASKIPSSISLAGKLSIKEMCVLLKHVNLLVTNDTGPMHLSFSMQTPTVALFCATDHHFCGPLDVKEAYVIQKAKTCTPCLKKKCREPFCLLQISPEEVYKNALQLFNAKSTLTQRGL